MKLNSDVPKVPQVVTTGLGLWLRLCEQVVFVPAAGRGTHVCPDGTLRQLSCSLAGSQHGWPGYPRGCSAGVENGNLSSCVPSSVRIKQPVVLQECSMATRHFNPLLGPQGQAVPPDTGSLSVCPAFALSSDLFLGYPSCINKEVLKTEHQKR